MAMLRDGGSKLKTGKKSETYKRQTQYGLVVDQMQYPLVIPGREKDGGMIFMKDIEPLIGVTDFAEHMKFAAENNFELFAKRAVIGNSKHVRIRPKFDKWSCAGTLTVPDTEQSGLTLEVLQRIFDLCGGLIGLCDWRPGSKTPGRFGKFTAKVTPID